eukprot:scaffold918_cov57-Skeletonema_menzelii.AAC.1
MDSVGDESRRRRYIFFYFDGSKIRWSWAREAWRQLMVGTQYYLCHLFAWGALSWALSCRLSFPSFPFWGAKKEGEKKEENPIDPGTVSSVNRYSNFGEITQVPTYRYYVQKFSFARHLRETLKLAEPSKKATMAERSAAAKIDQVNSRNIDRYLDDR